MSTHSFPTIAGTEVPQVLSGLIRNRLGTFASLSRRHPGGVRIPIPGRNVVVCSSETALRHVLVDNAAHYQKGLGQAEARGLLGSGILTGEGECWQEQRRSIAPLLRARRIADLVPSIVDEARTSLDAIDVANVEEVEMSIPLADYTLACLARVLGLDHPDTHRLVEAFEVVQNEAMFQALTLSRIPTWARPRTHQRVQRAQSILTHEAERVRKPLESEEAGAWAERDAVVSLLLAGYETTSSTLTWAMAYLGRRPHLQRLLAEEGQALAAASAAQSGLDLLDTLPTTRDVFHEVLRLNPPVWLLSRRAQQDDVIDGHRVRAGDDVVFCTSTLGMPGPAEFCPGSAAEGAHPFGLGPRACPGSQLAEAEAAIWLALAASRLTWELPPGQQITSNARMSQTIAGGLTCRIRSRSRSKTI